MCASCVGSNTAAKVPASSLLIHVPQCAAKWCQQHNAAAAPAAPPELPSSAEQLPRGAAAVEAFNAAMSSYWQQAALQRLEALASHSKVCTAERPHKPLPKPHPAAAAAGHICGDMCLDTSGPKQSPSSAGSGGPGSSGKAKAGAAAALSSGGGHICGDMCLDTSGPRSPPTKSGSGGPGRMPRALVCYLCGGQFFAKSLPIHLPQCQAKWMQQQMLLPPAQRLPLPQSPAALSGALPAAGRALQPPAALSGALGGGGTALPAAGRALQLEALSGVLGGGTALPAAGRALQEFNDAAFDTFNSASLVPCQACGRTFRPEALAHHAKHCTPDKPMRGPRQ
ncbi:hypothetical protein OEZ85_000409 [Tetradesmus obliquus]|uniref:Uncharacterized protein n=1 Tax=Tetradesmus obliquus TaxID=3088 RepID=A0ABY8USU4_TETOB|nr:hypothetical protein OEZ85_000409 [Tetradesmus obliquus]